MPRIPQRAVKVEKAAFFIQGNGFPELRHGFYVYLAISELPGCLQTFLQEQASQAFASYGGVKIHFHQLAYCRGQARGRINASAAGYMPVDETDMIPAARRLEEGVHIIEGLVIKGRAWFIQVKFFERCPDNRC